MCGRIIQASGPLLYQLVDGLDVPDSRLSNIPRRYNGAPSQELLVIRQNHKTGERSLDLLRDWVRTFTIITVPSNELIARIRDRMPAILRPADYERWLGSEPDPHDLLITFASEPMKMWPISKRVNSPRNDDEDLLAEVDLAAAS